MKILPILLCVLLASQELNAQFSRDWVHGLGTTGGEIGYSITADASGNVIITGNFVGTVDFDPGPGVVNLTAGGSFADAYLAKYSPTGNLIWAFSLGGTDTDIGEAVTTDAAGNIYFGISFGATIDMDPGAGVASFTSPGFSSSVIAKYDANGNYLWGFMLASLGSSGISGIKTDASGNVFFTGSYHGTVDFDPGPAVNNLVSNGNADVFFAKYDANGNYLLAKSFGAGAFDTGFFIELDASGSIFVSGYYRFTVDFDPGPGVGNMTASGTLNDIFLAKYDASGNYLWARTFGANSNDIPGGMTVDASGNVVVTGGFSGTVDFDPGAATVNLTALGRDVFVAKYDPNGTYVWAKRIGNTGTETAYGITGDGNGGFYLAGEFTATTDFDPGAGTVNLTSSGSTDIFIARYTPDGNLVHAGNMGGLQGDLPMDIASVDENHILVTGYFQFTADFDPGVGVSNLTSAGSFDIFFGKYTSFTGALPATLTSFTTVCSGNEITIKWSSLQEYNSKHYVIERSFSGSAFEAIATIDAAGNSNTPLHYSFTDRNTTANKIIYYRLKQTDRDDQFTYSKIITAGCAANEREVHLFPNPADKEITVSLRNSNQKIHSITVFDVSGRRVRTVQFAPSASITMDVRSLQKGVYWMQIDTGNGKLLTMLAR
ncbi:MAG TPA: T9SS type A sorting domain-containing protein [Chitinophagaceae bacterium]|nr:T9SS type A sorting domain-containing protein [Chitinophagaceae bacterium]